MRLLALLVDRMPHETVSNWKHAMLEHLGPNIWIGDGGIVPFFGYDYPTRMSVVRLENGGLWVWSPIELTADLERQVRALGDVQHLVSPNKLHYLFLAAWQNAFPNARMWGTPSTIAKVKTLRFTGVLGDEAPPAWPGQIDQFHFTNSPFLDELIFFHRASRTAIIADLSQPFSKAFLAHHWPWWLRTIAGMAKMVEGWGYPPPELRLSFRHRAVARHKISALIDAHPERVVVAHGEPAREGGEDYLRRAFSWLL